MKWLLDTNACIRYLNGRAPILKQRIDVALPADSCVCSVVKAEMFFGAARSTDAARALARQRYFLSRFRSLAFDDAAADAYGVVRAHLAAAGTPIGPNDLLIAAIAIANDVVLVTHNTSEFGRVPGVRIDDWEI
jgi:tRNA(fMet)-specific endonuclease VapC